MKVFIIEPHKEYICGFALVAANSRGEAKKLFFDENEFNQFLYKDYKCSCKKFKDLFYEGQDIILSNTIYSA